ncbi:MAG: PSD1 and planctomycete cytochrome C domain-containing protein [Fuerstiella sp.]|nr:PSD1 and planctomycete cytochrome C domain-containing protein [Fuerstiella sp.]
MKRSEIMNLIVVLVMTTGNLFADSNHVDFNRDVLPVLTKHCSECHGADLRESGLRIDDRDNLLRGGDHGRAAVVPGNPNKSFLLQLVRGDKPDQRMPPEGDLLSSEQIDLLERWIREGAEFNDQSGSDQTVGLGHWSFQPLHKLEVPGDDPSAANPIDAFIRRRLAESGLQPSVATTRRTLIRRVTLDLTGLPPSPASVETFVNSESEGRAAYDRVVDELLKSPRYGERWAQHWLDVVRWAETVGFETNFPRPNAWPYRDWVISALNEDRPYNRFLFEQIAGDTVGQDAALGFLVAGPANLPGQIGRDEEAMRQARQDELDEVIRTVSQSILGLTLDCARCHSHKFDPLTQRDYYAMQAVFAGLEYGDRRWRGTENDEWTNRVPEVQRQLVELQTRLESLRVRYQLEHSQMNVHTDSFDAVDARAIRMRIHATGNGGPASLYEFEVWSAGDQSGQRTNVALASSGSTPSASSFALANQTRHFDNLIDGSVDQRQAFPWISASQGPAWIQVDFPHPVRIDSLTWHRGATLPADYDIDILPLNSDEWTVVADSRNRLPRSDDTREAQNVRLSGLDTDMVKQITSLTGTIRDTQHQLNTLSAGPQVYAARFVTEPSATWLLRRGDPMQRVDIVEPGVPTVLRRAVMSAGADLSAAAHIIPVSATKTSERDRRLALAAHVTRPDHPLTARVMVNRVWQHHFGTGLVDSPSDFGRMGSKPTHPELLDWLAADFVEHGWSLKRLHRQIVTSQTYQQSSRPQGDGLRVDADARLLWRFPPRRLEAEAIRDTILSVSGRLNLTMGGPGFDFFNQRGGLSDYIPKETFEESGWRRMIYAHKIRMQAIDIFGTFDCPDAGQMTPQRTRSITPLQSLGLLNSPFANRHAEFFAQRVRDEVGSETAVQIDHSFLIALSRRPSDGERRHMMQLAQLHGLQQVCRVLFNTSEFLFLR